MLEEVKTMQISGVLPNIFKQPHYAAEVQDFLQNRATQEERDRILRCLRLMQQSAGAGPVQPTGLTSSAHLNARPAIASAGFQNQRKQARPADAATAHSSNSSSGSSWLYTATAAAAAGGRAQHRTPSKPIRSMSAVPAAARPKALSTHLPGRPASASTPAQPPAATSQNPGTAGFKSVNVTTNQAMHGLKDLYPDLWAATVPICRPDPAPNKNFVSEWGESLRQGSGAAWRPFLVTTSQLANLQVAKPTDEFAVRADEALVAWVAKQQMHFAELLSPAAAAAVSALLQGKAPGTSSSDRSAVSLADCKELLSVLRQLAAVVQPGRAKSTSHLLHCKQTSVEQPSTTALLKEQTRIRTMGFPRKVAVKGFRPASCTTMACTAAAGTAGNAAAAAAAGAAGHVTAPSAVGADVARGCSAHHDAAAVPVAGSRPAGARASEMIDTQKSKVPLKWASSNLVPPCSTYTANHGTHPGRSPQMFRTKFREVNVGMGHVDQHMYPPGSQVYPVESLYLGLPAKYQPQALDTKTTYRASFPAGLT